MDFNNFITNINTSISKLYKKTSWHLSVHGNDGSRSEYFGK